MTTTLFLLQYIDRSLELLERLDLTWMAEYHTTLDLVLVDTTEQQTYVITSLTLVKDLTEHLNTSYNWLLILTETEQLNLITYVDNTSLDTTSSNSTTTCDWEHVLNRHQEGLVSSTRRLLNPSVAGVHELHHLLLPLLNAVQSTEGRATNDRSIILELILLQNLADLHLNELQHLLILNHITLVQENNQTGNVYLTSKQNVLTSLRHRTVSSSYNKDSTIHLGSTSYHVLHIVSVTRAVNVSIVTLCSLVLNVSGVNSDTTLLLLRSVVNLIEWLNLRETLLCQNGGDSSSQSCLTVVNVTDSTNVYVRFGTHKLLFCHFLIVY